MQFRLPHNPTPRDLAWLDVFAFTARPEPRTVTGDATPEQPRRLSGAEALLADSLRRTVYGDPGFQRQQLRAEVAALFRPAAAPAYSRPVTASAARRADYSLTPEQHRQRVLDARLDAFHKAREAGRPVTASAAANLRASLRRALSDELAAS